MPYLMKISSSPYEDIFIALRRYLHQIMPVLRFKGQNRTQ